jgi:hypothetical protein
MNEVTEAIVRDLMTRVEILEARVNSRKPREYKHQAEYEICLDLPVNGSHPFEVDDDARKPLATSLLNKIHKNTNKRFISNVVDTAAILIRVA